MAKKSKLDKFKSKSVAINDTMGFKITTEEKDKFMKFCKDNDLKTGMVIRSLLIDFMEDMSHE